MIDRRRVGAASSPYKPGMVSRAKLAWKVFTNGFPRPHQAKESPLKWPSFREDTPQWQVIDYAAYCNEGFNANSLIYSSLMYKARASVAAPLTAYTGDPNHPQYLPIGHELQKLLLRPNSNQSGPELSQQNTVYLNISGNCYIHFDRPARGAFPVAMRSLRPDRVWIIPKAGGIKGYLYVPEGRSIVERDGIPILPEDMMHVRFPNPLDPLEGIGYGMSPMSAMARSADVDNDITKFLKIFFQHGTMTSTLLSFDVPLTDEEINRIRKRWGEIYGGYDNWAEVGVLDNTGKAQRLGMNFEEMGFESIDERSESRILGPFGVPVVLLGTRIGLKRGSFNNYETARRAFWQDTFVPELQLFQSSYQHFLREGDSWPAFDMSGVPALQQDIPKTVEAAHRLWTMGVPANKAFEVVGLPVQGVEFGDRGYIPISVTEVGKPVVPRGSSVNSPAGEVDGTPQRGNATPNQGAAGKILPLWERASLKRPATTSGSQLTG